MIFAVLLLLACYFSLIFVAIRCADGRIGINRVAGIRTQALMVNEQTWVAGHQAAKGPTLIGAYAAAVLTTSVLMMPSEALQATSILLAGFLMLAGVLWGAIKGTKAAKLALVQQR